MTRFRKKPVEIDAWQLDATNAAEILSWINNDGGECVMRGGDGGGGKGATLIIKTLEGNHHASHGDWIIRGVAGEFYPCKPDIFDATYDPVSGSIDGN